jgi:hypothetical protein
VHKENYFLSFNLNLSFFFGYEKRKLQWKLKHKTREKEISFFLSDKREKDILQSSKSNTGKEWLRDRNYNKLSSSHSQELENDWLLDKHVWCHNFIVWSIHKR